MPHTDLHSRCPWFPSVALKTLQKQKGVSSNHSHFPPSFTGYLLGVPEAQDCLVAQVHRACPAIKWHHQFNHELH